MMEDRILTDIARELGCIARSLEELVDLKQSELEWTGVALKTRRDRLREQKERASSIEQITKQP